MSRILFILLFSACLSSAQNKSALFRFSGHLSVLVGSKRIAPKNAALFVLPILRYAYTDSLGDFTIDSLKAGTYAIRVDEYYWEQEYKFKIDSVDISNVMIEITAICAVTAETALKDLKNKTPKLYVPGGIAPVYLIHQEKHEKKFGFEYVTFGCIAVPDECIVQYNKVIFEYLDKKYGTRWRKEIRPDVIGLR